MGAVSLLLSPKMEGVASMSVLGDIATINLIFVKHFGDLKDLRPDRNVQHCFPNRGAALLSSNLASFLSQKNTGHKLSVLVDIKGVCTRHSV